MKKIKISELGSFDLHSIKKQMVLLPASSVADNVADLDCTESSQNRALRFSVEQNGVQTPIVLCNGSIVDGYRRVRAASDAFGDDYEIPYIEIDESEVLQNVIAQIITCRKLTIQQRLFNVYQFIRTDHVKCLKYAEIMQKIGLKGSLGNDSPTGVAIPSFDGLEVFIPVPNHPVEKDFIRGRVQANYFDRYVELREQNNRIESPCNWLAEQLGCARKYLTHLDSIWKYFESLESEDERQAKFMASVELVNIQGLSLNNVLPALKGMDSKRDDLDPANEELMRKKWLERCKSSFAGLAEKVNAEYLAKTPDAKKTLFEYVQTAGFKRDSAQILRDIFADLCKQLDKQTA